jgi:hypothetical protein
MLDVFKQDAFSVIAMTDAFNKAPFSPGRAGQVLDWNEAGVSSLTIMLEEVGGELRLINPTPRGGPGETTPKDKRTARVLRIPHYQLDDAFMADEIQGVRAFGSETMLETLMSKIQSRLNDFAVQRFDPTLEYQRLGAIKGIILNGDGSTLYNLFTEFEVSAPDVVEFDVTDSSDLGRIRAVCDGIVRSMARRLGGIPFSGVHAFVGDAFWDGLIKNAEVRATFLSQMEASQLRSGTVNTIFHYGGIDFENYKGGLGGIDGAAYTPFIDTEDARFFPKGAPGLFRTVYGPADYIETVNTTGLPRYSKQFPMPNDKGISLEMQSNALSYCIRPTALVRGIAGSL